MKPRPLLSACLTLVIFATFTSCGTKEEEAAETNPLSGNWQTIELPTAAEFHGIQFLDEKRGYIAGGGHMVNGGIVGRTMDGGLTWALNSGYSKSRNIAFAIYDLWFHDDEHAFLAGHGGTFLTSETGWKGFESRHFGSRTSAHLRDIHFVDRRVGWVMGEGGLLATSDGGETWEWARRSTSETGYFSSRAIHFVDDKRGFLAGKFGKLQRTFDGGQTWEDPKEKPAWSKAPDLFGLDFVNTKKGWAVGEHGTIVHTDDGGGTWVAQASGVRDFLMDVSFQDEERGWAVGFDRALRRSVVLGTSDGGHTWLTEIEVPEEELRAIVALSSGHVWAVGKHAGRGAQKLLRRLPDR